MPRRATLEPHPLQPLPAGLPDVHALLAAAVIHAFETLRIGAALREKVQWHALHSPPVPLTAMELEHGKERERQAYNNRCTERVKRSKKTVLGHHAGFSDFFVPIMARGSVHTLLITGPFATARPTSADLLQRWHWLTGRQGHPSDPEFVRYVSSTLDTLLLEGDKLGRYRRMLECLAELLSGEGDARALGAEASKLRTKVEAARFVDHTWEAARSMVDDRTARTWLSPHKTNELFDVGLRQVPEHVVVGLWTGRRDASDRVAEMLAHDAFQRECVGLAQGSGNAVCGRVGDHGVVFLSGVGKILLRLGERAASVARQKYGLALHLGASAPKSAAPITGRYEEALGAAETALSRGAPIVIAAPGLRTTMSPLRRLREQLGEITEERPSVLSTRFERYVDAVCTHCGYRMEAVRAHLDAGFDRAAVVLRRTGVIDERSRMDTYDALDGAARDAATVDELVSAYRHAVSDLVAAAEHPVAAAQDHSLRRSLAFVAAHFTEPIRLAEIARVAGFAPRHFARLFRRRESTTFEAYVRTLRVERAKQLLDGTDLSVERVAQLCGFGLRPHFHRVFRQLVGKTPARFRGSRRRAPVYK